MLAAPWRWRRLPVLLSGVGVVASYTWASSHVFGTHHTATSVALLIVAAVVLALSFAPFSTRLSARLAVAVPVAGVATVPALSGLSTRCPLCLLAVGAPALFVLVHILVRDRAGTTTSEADGLEKVKKLPRILDHVREAVLLLDPSNDRIVDANVAACTLLEYPLAELKRTSISEIHAHELAKIRAFSEDVLRKGTASSTDLSCVTKGGAIVPAEIMSASVSPLSGGGQRMLAFVRDRRPELKQEEAERRFLYVTNHDTVTGLLNRAAFHAEIRGAFAAPPGPGATLYLVFLKVGGLARVSDGHGRAVGDQILVEVGRRIRDTVPDEAKVCRDSGGGFAVLMRQSHDVTVGLMEKLRAALTSPYDQVNRNISLTACFGVVDCTTGYESPEEALRDAQIAATSANKQSKERIRFFEGKLRDEAITRAQLESDLKTALQNESVVLNYQPIVRISDGSLHGFEALSRWTHPTLGFVSPARFVPVAEDCGLIGALDRSALRSAIRQLAHWQQVEALQGAPFVSVNLSATQADGEAYLSLLETLLRETSLDTRRIKVEITESSLVADTPENIRLFDGLREFGVEVFIDDFGTGYSSFAYLTRFKPDGLKIDRAFVSGVNESKDKREVVSSIVDLAHHLECVVVAEGIECTAELEVLQSVGCDLCQGHLFSKPVPADQVPVSISLEPN